MKKILLHGILGGFATFLLIAGLLCLAPGCATAPASHSPAPTDAGTNAASAAEDLMAEAYAHYATAVICELNQQPDKALDEYEKCVRADPSHEALAMELARRLLLRKQNDRAIALLDLAAKAPHASGQIITWKALAYMQAGKTNEAIATHRAALKRDPRQLLSYQGLAQLYFQAGQKNEVLKILTEAAKHAGPEAASQAGLAEMLAGFQSLLGKEGEPLKPRIETALNAALQQKPKDPQVLERIAETYKAIGQPGKASAAYKEIVAQNPDLTEARKRLAETYLYSNDTTNAIRELEQVIRDNPVEIQAYYLLGNLCLESRDYTKALDYFQKVRLLNHNFEPVHYDIARVNLALDKPKDALEALDQVKNKTRNFDWEFFSGLACVSAKDYEKAIEHYNNAEVIAKATATNRLTHVFYFQLGAAHERAQHYTDAERYFEQCLKLDPNDAETMNYLGYMWAERGEKLDQAKELIQKALQLDPDNAAFLDSMGWVLYQMNEAKEALTFLLKAVQNSSKPDATLYDHLGDTYQKLRQLDRAQESWRKSLELEPNEAIKKKLETP